MLHAAWEAVAKGAAVDRAPDLTEGARMLAAGEALREVAADGRGSAGCGVADREVAGGAEGWRARELAWLAWGCSSGCSSAPVPWGGG